MNKENFYKKYDNSEWNPLFYNYALTELMLLKKGKKEILWVESPAISLLLGNKLKEYGISLFGKISVKDMEFRGVSIDADFPIENEPIIKQLYGYTNIVIDIMIDAFQDYAVSFKYNVDKGSCELEKYVCYSMVAVMKYPSLKEMLDDIKNREYSEIFQSQNTSKHTLKI